MIRQRVQALILVALVLWAPLPFGSARPEHRTILLFGISALVLASLRPTARVGHWRAAVLPASAVAGIALLGFFQAAPQPDFVVSLLSPQHARLATMAGTDPSRLTLAPSVTVATGLWWLGLAGVCLATATLGRGGRRAVVVALLAAGMIQVLLGAQLWLHDSDEIWGRVVPGLPGRLRGTFVNANHAAFFVELLLPVAFALSCWGFEHVRRFELPLERRLVLLPVGPLVWLVLFVGLALTGSRAGMLAALVAVAVQGLLWSRVRRSWSLAIAGLAAAASGLAVLGWIGLRRGASRLLELSAYDVDLIDRVSAYSAAVKLWLRFPVFGSGLGSFREGFDLVRPAGVGSTWRHLHNDPLELLATTGVVGAALLTVATVAVVRRLGPLLVGARRSEDRLTALAMCGVLAAAAIHSCLDFSLAVPANALTLSVLTGLVLGATPPRISRHGVIEVKKRDVRVLE